MHADQRHSSDPRYMPNVIGIDEGDFISCTRYSGFIVSDSNSGEDKIMFERIAKFVCDHERDKDNMINEVYLRGR